MKNQNKMLMTAAMLGVMVVGLGGCSTVTAPPAISQFDKTGKGELFIVVAVGGRDSGEATCAKAKEVSVGEIKDGRCERPQDFYSRLGAPSYKSSFTNYIPVLIPNNVLVENQDIIKIRMKDGMPAYFERVVTKAANRRDTTSECFLDWSLMGSGGVVCPKHNWDYRNYVPNP